MPNFECLFLYPVNGKLPENDMLPRALFSVCICTTRRNVEVMQATQKIIAYRLNKVWTKECMLHELQFSTQLTSCRLPLFIFLPYVRIMTQIMHVFLFRSSSPYFFSFVLAEKVSDFLICDFSDFSDFIHAIKLGAKNLSKTVF